MIERKNVYPINSRELESASCELTAFTADIDGYAILPDNWRDKARTFTELTNLVAGLDKSLERA